MKSKKVLAAALAAALAVSMAACSGGTSSGGTTASGSGEGGGATGETVNLTIWSPPDTAGIEQWWVDTLNTWNSEHPEDRKSVV